MINSQTQIEENTKTQFITQAISEVIGADVVPEDNKIITLESIQLQWLWEELTNRYGRPGCSGVAYRVGQAMIKYGLQEFGPIIGAAGLEFRLSPTHKKLRMSLEGLAEILRQYLGQDVILEDLEDYFVFSVTDFNPTMTNPAKTAVDQVIKGMVQEALDWASGGKYFSVQLCETNSTASCLLKIDNTPL